MKEMPRNEARELLVRGYEATHNAEGIAKAYSVNKWTVYRLAELNDSASGRTRLAAQAVSRGSASIRFGGGV